MSDKSRAANDVANGITNNFDNWLNELEEAKQPTCNINNPDDCETCGS